MTSEEFVYNLSGQKKIILFSIFQNTPLTQMFMGGNQILLTPVVVWLPCQENWCCFWIPGCV